MSNEFPRNLPSAETSIGPGSQPGLPPRPHLSGRRLALAFTVAALADGFSLLFTFAPPAQWAADLVTAILLFIVLGWQWILLPGLILEAIPGFYIFPFWVLVVGAVGLWGTAHPKLRSLRTDPDKR